jgi:hypothetical protein
MKLGSLRQARAPDLFCKVLRYSMSQDSSQTATALASALHLAAQLTDDPVVVVLQLCAVVRLSSCSNELESNFHVLPYASTPSPISEYQFSYGVQLTVNLLFWI